MRGNGGTPTSARLRRSEFPAHCRRRAQTGRNSGGLPEFSPAQRAARGIQSGRFSKHAPNIGGGGPARCDFGRVGRSPLSISPYFKVSQKNSGRGHRTFRSISCTGDPEGGCTMGPPFTLILCMGILGYSWAFLAPRVSARRDSRGQEYPRIPKNPPQVAARANLPRNRAAANLTAR